MATQEPKTKCEHGVDLRETCPICRAAVQAKTQAEDKARMERVNATISKVIRAPGAACQERLRKHMESVDGQIRDEDLPALLLLQIALDTREMLLIAQENQAYIRETMKGLVNGKPGDEQPHHD